jgi:hypothetical protein
MSRSKSTRTPEHARIHIEGVAPSWAGEDPLGDGFCIGSEDGAVALTDEAGKTVGELLAIAQSREAINGVAGFEGYFAASTRQEIAILEGLAQSDEQPVLRTIHCGAHGILAASCREFLAPLGHEGIMSIRPIEGAEPARQVYSVTDTSLNVYQLYEIPPLGRQQLFVAACRSQGVGLIDYSPETRALGFSAGNLANTDVLDVVPVGTSEYPHAIAALGLAGEVILCRDIVKQEAPILLKYSAQFAGRTYRILSACGHLIVLTSKAIYVLGNLAGRLTQPSFDESDSPIMTLPMEAIDANICGNRWLLTVMHDYVGRYDVQQIHDLIADFASTPLPRTRLKKGDWQPLNGDRGRLQTTVC